MLTRVLEKLLTPNGAITNVYGKYSDAIVYDQDREGAKLKLELLYGYKDIKTLLPPELDDQRVMDHMRTLMTIDIMQNPETTSLESKKDISL